MFWRRRAATQRWLRFALGGVALVAVLGTTVAAGVAARQPDVAVRSALSAATADSGSMVWERQAASDAAAQDAATRARLHRAFGAAVTIATSAVGDPLPVAGSSRLVLPLRDDATLRAAASGLPSVGAGALAIDDAGARALGVGVGDTVRVRTDAGVRALRVAAVWHATDPRAPIWNGIGPGASGAAARVVLSGAELTADHVDLTARWSVAPDPARVRAAELPALESGYARLAATANGSASFTQLSGGGAATVSALRAGDAAAAAVVPVPIALLAAAALLALLLLVRLLAEVRAEETALLRARGAARTQIAGGDLRAALLPVLVGAAVGWIAAQAALWLLVAPPTGWADLALPGAVPTAVALLVVVVASFLSAAPERAGSGRGGRIAAVAGAALLGLLAIVGVARLVGAGVGADPAAELAPALVVAALVVAGLLLGAPLAAGWDAIVRRRDGVAAPLAARRLRRGPGLVAGALVLVALAVGASGFAAGAVSSSADFLRNAGRLVAGGDLDVAAPGDASVASGTPSPDVDRLARVARASGAAPALIESVGVGDLNATLTAAPVARMAALQDAALADLAALRATAAAPVGIPLTGAGSLRLGVDARAAAAPDDARVELTAWLVRADGAAVRLDLPGAPLGTSTVEGRLPGAGPWRLVALDAAVQSSGAVEGLAVTVDSVARVGSDGAHASTTPATAWTLTGAYAAASGSSASGTLGWSVPGAVDAQGGRAELGRIMPPGGSTVPAAVSRPLAAAAGLSPGDRATLDAGASGIPVRVVAVVPHVIGVTGPSGVWVDLPTLQVAQLRTGADLPRPDHAWFAVADPLAAAARVAASDPATIPATAPAATIGPLALPATVGAVTAAAGTVLFALLAIATAIAALLRARGAEVAVLRALGAGSRLQRLAARIELLSVLVYAVVVGAVAAVVAVALTVPQLAHAAAPGIGPEVAAPIAVDPILIGSAVLVLALGAAIGLAVQERAVRRVAEHPRIAEVER